LNNIYEKEKKLKKKKIYAKIDNISNQNAILIVKV